MRNQKHYSRGLWYKGRMVTPPTGKRYRHAILWEHQWWRNRPHYGCVWFRPMGKGVRPADPFRGKSRAEIRKVAGPRPQHRW